MEFLGRLRIHVYASPFRASGNQLVMIISSAPATVAANEYSCRKSRGVCGAVVVANVDLEFLGPLDTTELESEGQAALPDVVILAFSMVALPTSLDAGAHVFSLTLVEVMAEILVMCGGRSDEDGLAAIAVQPVRHRRCRTRRYGGCSLSLALTTGMGPRRARLTPGSRRAINCGGPSRIGPWTTIGVVEESFHACSPLLVDLGIAVLGWELHQSLCRDEGVVASLQVRRQRR